jgi:hypothetical protein
VKRYVVRALVEPSSEVVSVLTAASMAVHNGHPGGATDTTVKVDPTGPKKGASEVSAALTLPPDAQPLTVTVNAPTREEAAAKVRETLSAWGEIPVEVIREEEL